jgi:hypothetical protein
MMRIMLMDVPDVVASVDERRTSGRLQHENLPSVELKSTQSHFEKGIIRISLLDHAALADNTAVIGALDLNE